MPRISPVEPRRSFSIYVPNSLYLKLEKKAGKGRLNIFINQVLVKELSDDNEQKLKQQLIKDYQSVAQSQARKKEDEIWDETLNDAWEKD